MFLWHYVVVVDVVVVLVVLVVVVPAGGGCRGGNGGGSGGSSGGCGCYATTKSDGIASRSSGGDREKLEGSRSQPATDRAGIYSTTPSHPDRATGSENRWQQEPGRVLRWMLKLSVIAAEVEAQPEGTTEQA